MKSCHKRSPSLHSFFICMDYDICMTLNTITYNDYVNLLQIYWNVNHKIPDKFEIFTIKPEMFKEIHKSVNVSIDIEIYKIFINLLDNWQFRNQIQNVFGISDEQIDFIIEYFDFLASNEDIEKCKNAFANSVSKNTFRQLLMNHTLIIIDRIEFSPTEFRKIMNNDNKYSIYSSNNLKEIYLKRYLQKPRKHDNEIEYIRIDNFVYRVDNLFK